MCSEPNYLEDESLTDNLDDDEAQRIYSWLRAVANMSGISEKSIGIAWLINSLFSNITIEEKQDIIVVIEKYCQCSLSIADIESSDLFNIILSKLEEQIDNTQTNF